MTRLLHSRRTAALGALVALLACALAGAPLSGHGRDGGSAGTVEGVPAATLFDRVHVIGASASFGFGVRPPVPADHPGRLTHLPLARVAQAAQLNSGSVSGDATSFFFTSPIPIGAKQVDAAIARSPRPTIVLAVDYLFWFLYGARDTERAAIREESQRLAMFEVGLANVERLTKAGVPVIVGDLPNMSGAVGKMLSKAQMPEQATLDAANKRLAEWAQAHPMVAIVPLAALVKQLDSDQPFTAGGRTWSSKVDGPLIQADQLHPTLAGTVALIARAEQTANQHFRGGDPSTLPQAFEHDPGKVSAKVREQIETELAAREADRKKAKEASPAH